jgi:hypothetical protein
VKIFRVVLSTKRTDYVVTNDMVQDNTQAVQEVCGFRWKVEQFQPRNQAVDWPGRLPMPQGQDCPQSHACAILVWVRLKQVANETKQTVYRLKHGLLSDYLRQQLKSPTIQMSFA